MDKAKLVTQIIRLWRPWFWLPALGSAFAGYTLVPPPDRAWWEPFLLLLCLGPGICGFAETVNDYFDYGIDCRGTRKTFCGMALAGGSGTLVENPVERLSLCRSAAVASLCIALIAGFLLSPLSGLLAVLGLLASWAYSAPPLRAKTRGPWGIVLQGLGYGPIAIGVACLTAPSPTVLLHLILLSAPVGAWMASVGMTADLLDFDDDSKQGVTTLATKLGKWKAEILILTLGMLSLLIAFLVHVLLLNSTGVLVLPLTGFFCMYAVFLHRGIQSQLQPFVHAIAVCLEFAFPIVLALGL